MASCPQDLKEESWRRRQEQLEKNETRKEAGKEFGEEATWTHATTWAASPKASEATTSAAARKASTSTAITCDEGTSGEISTKTAASAQAAASTETTAPT